MVRNLLLTRKVCLASHLFSTPRKKVKISLKKVLVELLHRVHCGPIDSALSADTNQVNRYHKTMKRNEYTLAARSAHHAALASLYRGKGLADGLKMWRALRRIESRVSDLMTAQCNGADYNGQPYLPDDDNGDNSALDIRLEKERGAIAKVFGGHLPDGFFFNHDPRGYALKIRADKPGQDYRIPSGLVTDWGGYGCLAAVID